MTQRLTKHVIRTHKQSGNCAVESPQSRDSPTTMLYYVHQTHFFPAPTQKKRVWLRETKRVGDTGTYYLHALGVLTITRITYKTLYKTEYKTRSYLHKNKSTGDHTSPDLAPDLGYVAL